MTDRRKSPCGPSLNNDRRKGDRRKLADRRTGLIGVYSGPYRRGGYRRISDLIKSGATMCNMLVATRLSERVVELQERVANLTNRLQAAESKLAEIRKVANGS